MNPRTGEVLVQEYDSTEEASKEIIKAIKNVVEGKEETGIYKPKITPSQN